MKNWLGKSLKHRLSLLIIVATLVPLLFLGFFAYRTTAALTEEKAKISGMNTLRQLEAYLATMVQDVENMSLFLIGNTGVQNYLKSPEGDFVQQTSIINFLTNLAFSKEYIANIIIEPLTAKPPISHKSLVGSDFTDITQMYPKYYDEYPKWWSSVHRQWTFDGVRKVITLARPIRSTDKFKPIGKEQINLDQGIIAQQIRESVLEESGFVLLLDDRNRILAGPPEMETGYLLSSYYPNIEPFEGPSGFMDYGEGSAKKTILYKTMESVNWKLVGIIPSEEYRSQNRYFLTLTAVAVSVAILFVIIFVLVLIQKITKPLSALTNFLKNSSPEEPLPAIPVKSIDEVGQLIVSYNKLSSRIVKLTDEVKWNESLKKEADMQALQIQINPHFLYNTLSSIHWLALMNGDGKIAEMVGSLSEFLRFSLNNGQEYCSIEQEIAHVNNYVNIQSIRYPDKFTFQVNVDPGIQEQHFMLKLLLQPLVENAMLHGILKRDGLGSITIYADCDEEGIHFTVVDDGIGIALERLDWLRTQLSEPPVHEKRISTKGGYWLRNVNNRLLLHYGKESGLHVESKEGEGTRIMFTIPYTEYGNN
ncbi:cache domain-containing sensor histidine kinase [Paenibacillus macquariensis]|uniref:Two-component system, sensor histidine kinase YesM n=1 Tax=Paenibacillus macquariensis TaxID=948756 RepID=A0ABY1K5W7_9BACL|nr:sensor histidine kinase [Paenibacillus macquariensis]MEC0090520.1 sensor histidine kinase [Paenibacillus macquariensis]SIR30519.1 two-component system, sensor histidine kinase YesM [Paenibacillus macquariensis]